MCLTTVDRVEGIAKSGFGWKLFRIAGDELLPFCCGQETAFEPNIWYTATEKAEGGCVPVGCGHFDFKPYRQGFHLFKTKESAEKFPSGFNPAIHVVVPIEYDEAICEGSQTPLGIQSIKIIPALEDVVVAEKIRVVKDGL